MLPAAFTNGFGDFAFSFLSLVSLVLTFVALGPRAAVVFTAIASMVGISELRRRTRVQLRHAVDFLGSITGDPEEAVCALNREGRVVFVNPAAERMLGWTSAELVGQDLHEMMHAASGTTGRNPPNSCCSLRSILRPTEHVRTGEHELQLSAGTIRRVAYTASPICRGGRLSGISLRFRDITENLRAVESLREREERYRVLVDMSPDGIVLTDLYGYVTMANMKVADMYGCERSDELLGKRFVELVIPDDRLRAAEQRNEALSDGSIQSGEYVALRNNGTTFPLEVRASVVADDKGKPAALIAVCRDITERRRTEVTLQRHEMCAAVQNVATTVLAHSITRGEAISNLLPAVAEAAGWDVGVLWSREKDDDALRCQYVWHGPSLDIARFTQVTRRLSLASGEDLPGRAWKTGVAEWVPDIVSDSHFPRALMASQVGLHTAFCLPIFADGSLHVVMEFFDRDVLEEDQDLIRVMTTIGVQLGQFLDRKGAEKALEYQTRHDTLTGLPNRLLLQERLRRVVGIAPPEAGSLSLLLLDLDRFKEVNDTLGHHYGDLLLQQVSVRLQESLRDSDTVARLGGDEFAILLPSTDAEGAESMADRLLRALEQPYWLEGNEVDVSASIGIAVYPEHGSDTNVLMQRADVAMYVAKRAQRGHAVYSFEEDSHSPGRLALTAELRQAIENERLLLHYQPKVDVRTGQINSVEALVRWHHSQRGLVPPNEFVPLAEQTGMIGALGFSVLNEALRQSRRWHDERLHLRVSVNLSTQNLHDPQLPRTIARLLKTHNMQAEWLAVEVTETAIMADSARAKEILEALHDMGIRISIDDFGTGYSSLAYLTRLPVDEIKIDKSFVIDMGEKDDDAFIARSVIDLGHNLGLEVVAEGVQSAEILDLLSDMQCDHVQGFYLCRPLPATDLKVWLREKSVPSRMTGPLILPHNA